MPAELRYDYGGRCWWCGGVADSREHKWKRSDLVRMFGPGPYRGDVSWGRGNEVRDPQGASSSALKFAANLCRRCNNERSQPFDRAYDVWASWVKENLQPLQELEHVRLTEPFGSNPGPHVDHLARYFAKHVGCRLASEGVEVPPDLIAFLDGNLSRPRGMRAGFGIRLDIRAFNHQLKQEGIYETPGLWMRPLQCWYSPSAAAVVEVWSGLSIGPFEFWYWLRLLDLPEPNFADYFQSEIVRLPRYDARGPIEQASPWHKPGE